MKEPSWKLVLCWAAVIFFFLLPIGFFSIHMYALTHPGWVSGPLQDKEEYDFDYVKSLQRDITFLVFGLAGLKTWEVIKNGNNKEQHK